MPRWIINDTVCVYTCNEASKNPQQGRERSFTFSVLASEVDAETTDIVQGGQQLAVLQALAVISSGNDVIPKQIWQIDQHTITEWRE